MFCGKLPKAVINDVYTIRQTSAQVMVIGPKESGKTSLCERLVTSSKSDQIATEKHPQTAFTVDIHQLEEDSKHGGWRLATKGRIQKRQNKSLEHIFNRSSLDVQKLWREGWEEETDKDKLLDSLKGKFPPIISLWDFGGTDPGMCYALQRVFFSKYAVYLLVFDLRKPLNYVVNKTCPDQENPWKVIDYIHYWLECIRIEADGTMPAVFLIGTHEDMKDANEKLLEEIKEALNGYCYKEFIQACFTVGYSSSAAEGFNEILGRIIKCKQSKDHQLQLSFFGLINELDESESRTVTGEALGKMGGKYNLKAKDIVGTLHFRRLISLKTLDGGSGGSDDDIIFDMKYLPEILAKCYNTETDCIRDDLFTEDELTKYLPNKKLKLMLNKFGISVKLPAKVTRRNSIQPNGDEKHDWHVLPWKLAGDKRDDSKFKVPNLSILLGKNFSPVRGLHQLLVGLMQKGWGNTKFTMRSGEFVISTYEQTSKTKKKLFINIEEKRMKKNVKDKKIETGDPYLLIRARAGDNDVSGLDQYKETILNLLEDTNPRAFVICKGCEAVITLPTTNKECYACSTECPILELKPWFESFEDLMKTPKPPNSQKEVFNFEMASKDKAEDIHQTEDPGRQREVRGAKKMQLSVDDPETARKTATEDLARSNAKIRNSIDSCLVQLVKELDVNAILMAELLARKAIDDGTKQKIQAQGTPQEKADCLLDYIKLNPSDRAPELIRALNENNQTHLAEILKDSLTFLP